MSTEVSAVFNGAVGGAAIAALDELGVFDALRDNESLDVAAYCTAHGLHGASLEAMLRALQCFAIVELSDDRNVARRGSAFAEAYRNKGYFLWLVRGYGGMLNQMATIARNENRTGGSAGRDGRYIALAGRDYGAQFVDDEFAAVLSAGPARFAADLGCGGAERLIKLARKDLAFRGIGVEMNADSLALAHEAVTSAGLQDRITVIRGDVANLAPHSAFAEVDVIFSFFAGHDLWPRSNCLHSLNTIYSVFPAAERFLLCDTYRSEQATTDAVPTFTLGFELTHALMRQHVPTLSEWLDLLRETRWDCVGRHAISVPFSCVFELRRDH